MRRRKFQKAQLYWQIVVNRLHAAAHKIGLVPETRSARIPQKLFPPRAMRLRPRPFFQRLKISPVLPHCKVRRKKRHHHRFVQQQSIRFRCHRVRNLRPESQQRLYTTQRIYAHPQIDHHQIWIAAQVHRASVHFPHLRPPLYILLSFREVRYGASLRSARA